MTARQSIVVAVALLMLPAPAAAQPSAEHAEQMAAGQELFRSKVGLLLKDNCLACHGGGKTRGDFDLATREALLTGGAEGVAVVPGNPKASKLLTLLRHEDEPHMPSKKPRLPDGDIAAIARWIELGAPYGEPLVAGAMEAKDRSVVTDADKQFWSFQRLRHAEPPNVQDGSWPRTPVDRFILAKLEENKISPNPTSDRSRLIRRAYLDVIGLPPKPEEVEAFLADFSPDAYEKLIDRLLASPRYGERWGRHWLDLARFGESHGYQFDDDRPFAYHYRDFVIRALNDDLPYDKFVKWQIAGDEIEPQHMPAWLATGFLGAGTHASQITANQAEKERYDELDDIAQTIGTSMLGLTIGCARCHDHKYDPIPTADYYRLISTFTTTVRSDRAFDINPAKTRAAEAAWEREHAPLVAALQKFERDELPARFEQWLGSKRELPRPAWLTLEADSLDISGPFAVESHRRLDDGSYLVSVTGGSPETYRFAMKTKLALTNVKAIRLEAIPDKSLPNYGPGWSKNGDINLTAFTLDLQAAGLDTPLELVSRRETTTKSHDEPADKIGQRKKFQAWTLGQATGREQALAFEFATPADFAEGTGLIVTMSFRGDRDRPVLGRFRLSVSLEKDAALSAEPFPLKTYEEARQFANSSRQSALHTPNEQREALVRLYRTVDPEWQKLNRAVIAHARRKPRPQVVKALVCSEGLPAIRLRTQGPDYYEKSYLLKRGDLSQKNGEADQGFLQVLMRAPQQEKHWFVPAAKDARTPMRRTALANWLTDLDNGAGSLLARVIVNRLWQHHLGRAIVSTPSDFGASGERPTHPELLDWLAIELIKSCWRLKPIHRLILTSAVYMQDNGTDAKRLNLDPDNKLLWRHRPQRLEAEIVRDAILAASGRLEPTMFGPGTLDEGMERRSIYFLVKRSKLIPMMVQFDAPDSLQGLGRRANTTVAPQALLLMNNPQIRASALAFAQLLTEPAEESLGDAVERAYEIALSRLPTKQERADAVAFLEWQQTTYDKPDALQLALADFCQVMFGLNEFVYVE